MKKSLLLATSLLVLIAATGMRKGVFGFLPGLLRDHLFDWPEAVD